MVAFAPVSIAMNGLGLNITGFSYHGTLWICTVACRDMMPDPAFFADCLRSSFARLSAAAAESRPGTPAAKSAAPKTRPRSAVATSKARGKPASKAHGTAASQARGKVASKRKTRIARRKQGGRRHKA